jgi:hypothetical protein
MDFFDEEIPVELNLKLHHPLIKLPIEINLKLKKCWKCQQHKSLNEFHKNKSKKDGIASNCKQCNTVFMREYFRNNTNARIAHNIRNRLNMALKGKKKHQSTKKLIGIDYDLYIQWMQFQLPEGYSMDDIGKKLHIDHVRPLSSYDLSDPEQLEEACSWRNLAPIPANENLSKNDRIDEAAIKTANES